MSKRTKAMRPNSMQVSEKHPAKRLLSYVFQYYPCLFLGVCISIIFSAFAAVAGSYFIGNILIDKYLTPSIFVVDPSTGNPLREGGKVVFQRDPKATFASLRFWNLSFNQARLVLGAIFVVGITGGFFYNYGMAKIAQGVQKIIRDERFSHRLDLPVSYFDQHTHGDIRSIYSNDVDALRERLARAIPMSFSSLVSRTLCLVRRIGTDIYRTILVIAFAFIMFVLSRYFASHSGLYFRAQQDELGKINGYIEERISGQKVIKVFNHEKENIDGFSKHNEELFNDAVKANRYANTLRPMINQLGNLQYAIIAFIGGRRRIYNVRAIHLFSSSNIYGFYTIGIISSFLRYSKAFVQPIGQISQQLNSIALALAGSGRIFSLIDEKAEVDEGYVELVNAKKDENGNPIETTERTGRWAWKHPHKDNTPTSYTWLKGDITLDHVDFGYTQEKIVLHDITLYAKPGQKVAFVGPTGAGKTTITNLLNRFYDIADGKIRYDDININKIKKSDLRRSLGRVFQDTKLFTGTVMENIRYGKLDATDEEVMAAAKLANADTFISQLPNGYHTRLKDSGSGLSQGQRQLLAIARAAVANPPVLILDEATSSIDSRTEAMVQKGRDGIRKGRTVFVIAHRLSTIKNADVIMVLENGHIIERGNHEQLLAEKGKYYQLYTGNAIEKQED